MTNNLAYLGNYVQFLLSVSVSILSFIKMIEKIPSTIKEYFKYIFCSRGQGKRHMGDI